MRCPFCEADRIELIAQFGSQLLFSQYRCRACRSYFEGLREENPPLPVGEVARSEAEGDP
jgi:hypothetical protein